MPSIKIKSYPMFHSVRKWLIGWIILSMNFLFLPDGYADELKISRHSIDALNNIGQAMAEIAESVKPTIVNISTTRIIKLRERHSPFFDDPLFRRFFGESFRMPKERKTANLGSGVIVDSQGYILTANHVIQGADEIRVSLSDKREFKGTVVGNDALTDIGVIQIDAEDLPIIKWGDSDKLRVGETVLAIGSPYGLSQTVTSGIVSAVGRANVGIADYEDFIQTDAAINPGNSGGALVNVRGELIGINTAIFSTTGGYQGIGFAIPSNMAKAVMDNLIQKGKVIRGWLGVSVQVITPELAKQFDLKEDKGALVSDVIEGSPAEKAGIQRGDVIIEFASKKIEEPYQLKNIVANTSPGQLVEVNILRENKSIKKKVLIGELLTEMQKLSTGEYNNLLRGVVVQDITPEIYGRNNLPKKLKGVIVSAVSEDSPASMVLIEGDIIQEIDRQRTTNVREYENIVSGLSPEDDVLLLIFRKKSSLYITLSAK